jgi:hypothetical protein
LFTEDGKTSLGTACIRIRSAKVPVETSDLLSASTARPGRNHAQGLPKIDEHVRKDQTTWELLDGEDHGFRRFVDPLPE